MNAGNTIIAQCEHGVGVCQKNDNSRTRDVNLMCDNKLCSQLPSYITDCQQCREHAVLKWTAQVSQTKTTESLFLSLIIVDYIHNCCHNLNTCNTSYQKDNHPWVGRARWHSLSEVTIAFHALLAECWDLSGGGHGNWAEIIYSKWGGLAGATSMRF